MIVYQDEYRPGLELCLDPMLGHQSPQRFIIRRLEYRCFGQSLIAELKCHQDALIKCVFPLRLQR